MQVNSATFRSIVFACAIIGACQSVIWLVLATCALLTFRCVLTTPQYDTDHLILTTIVKLYFEGEDCKVEGNPNGYPDISEAKLTKPIEVFSWMIAFMVISSIQLILSLCLVKGSNGDSARSTLRDWCFTTFLLAVMDTALSAIFIIDFVRLKEFLEEQAKEDEEGIVAAPASMFIVAARGFALWIVNVASLIYFAIWFLDTAIHKRESTGKEIKGEKETGHENFAFKSSTESLAFLYSGRTDMPSFNTSQDIIYRPNKNNQRTYSETSFEAVTPFNEEEYSEVIVDNPGRIKKEAERVTCNCQWMDGKRIFSNLGMSDTIYHGHGCSALRPELEKKLSALRRNDDQMIHRPKKLEDFSHDIRNFTSGGQNKTKTVPHHGRVPKAPPLPAAATCSDSNFY